MRMLMIAVFSCVALVAAVDPVADLARRVAQDVEQPGLAVVIGGAVDLPLALRRASSGRLLVHALCADPAVARQRMGAELGPITIAPAAHGGRIPLHDRLANLVLCAEAGIDDAELQRIAQPGGRIVRFDPAHPEVVRTVPSSQRSGEDEWTHANRDATGNPVSNDRLLTVPESLRWIGDRARGFGSYASRAGDGRFIHCFDVYDAAIRDPQPRSNAADKDRLISGIELVARDARNGVTLWSRIIPGQGRAQPVLAGPRIVLPFGSSVQILDAASGTTAATVADLGTVVDAAVVDGLVVVRSRDGLHGLSLDGARRWNAELPMPGSHQLPQSNFMVNQRFDLVVAGGGLAYAITAKGNAKAELVAVALADGAVRWRVAQDSLGAGAYPAFWFADRLYLTSAFGYACAAATSGALLWSTKDLMAFDSKGSRFAQSQEPARTMFGRSRHWTPQAFLAADDLIWVRMEGRRRTGANDPPLTDDELRIPAKGWLGLDPATGTERRRLSYPSTTAWLARCYPDIAVGDRLLSWAMEVFSLRDGSFAQYRSTRGVCGSGFQVAYGQIVVPPTPCLYCFPMLRGANAQGAVPTGERPIADADRLERGPLYQARREPLPIMRDPWPSYRFDAARSNASPALLSLASASAAAAGSATAGSAAVAWQVALPGRSSQIIAAHGLVFSTEIDAGRITALDAATGARRWSWTAGARIDTAPTIAREALYVGSHDGTLSCLDPASGMLIWRFHAAPAERRIVAFDQVESAWPVLGTVTVIGATVYALAGRQTTVDGGMTLWALDADTGAIRWRQQLTGVGGARAQQMPKAFFTPIDHMVLNPIVPAGVGVISLHDQYTAWYFAADTGAQIDRPGDLRLRWRGFDRGLQAFIASGQEPWFHHRYLDSMEPRPVPAGDERDYSAAFAAAGHGPATAAPIPHRLQNLDNSNPLTPQQQAWVFPATTGFGANLRKLPTGKPTRTEVWPASYDRPDLSPAEMPWPGVSLPIDAKAMLIADDTILVAGGTTFTRDHDATQIIAISRRDGAFRTLATLPGGLSFDGLSVADGRIYLAMRDGRVVCFAQR